MFLLNIIKLQILLWIPYTSVLAITSIECGSAKSATLKIKDKILCDYDKSTRPVISHTNLTKVTLHMKLRYFDYDETAYTLNVDAWLPMLWDDPHLMWNPSDYDDIAEIHISSDEIWTPDISLYNKGDLSVGPRVYETADCMVSHEGKVVCLPVVDLEALCTPNMTYWPYDTQVCQVKIGSWIHRGDEIDFEISRKNVITEGYTPNAQWSLVNNTVKRDPGNFFGLNNSYPSIIYTFEVKRHSAAAAATVVMPAMAMMIMAILTLYLEPKSEDRIYLCALNLSCHFLYLQHVTWEVPLNGDTVANIVLFFRDSMLLTAITLIETVIVRGLLEMKRQTPIWLVTSFTAILNNRIGQLVVLTEVDPKEAAVTVKEDDTSNLVDVSTSSNRQEWFLLGRLIDRICFFVYIIVYAIMLIIYLPK